MLNPEKGQIIDHINNNKLDNRLTNLRISSHVLNAHNRSKKKNTTSKYIGVSSYKSKDPNKKYRANITKNHINYNLGYFPNEIDAAKEYDKKAIELYGSYAQLNNISN